MARALPFALYRTRKRLDFSLLRRLARERGQGRTLGFFLDLTAELSGDRSLAREARPLAGEARRRVRASQFFKLRSATERRLAELKTPPVARRWGFRMNMSADSFASMFEGGAGLRVSAFRKYTREELVRFVRSLDLFIDEPTNLLVSEAPQRRSNTGRPGARRTSNLDERAASGGEGGGGGEGGNRARGADREGWRDRRSLPLRD